MTLKRKASGSWVDVTSVKHRSGGSWVAVTEVRKRLSGAWVKVWPTVPPIVISGSGSYSSTGPVGGSSRLKVVTSALSVSGGTGIYTYAWSYLSGDVLTVSNTTILNPTFSKTLPPDTGTTSTYRLAVTSGSDVAYYDIYIALTN